MRPFISWALLLGLLLQVGCKNIMDESVLPIKDGFMGYAARIVQPVDEKWTQYGAWGGYVREIEYLKGEDKINAIIFENRDFQDAYDLGGNLMAHHRDWENMTPKSLSVDGYQVIRLSGRKGDSFYTVLCGSGSRYLLVLEPNKQNLEWDVKAFAQQLLRYC